MTPSSSAAAAAAASAAPASSASAVASRTSSARPRSGPGHAGSSRPPLRVVPVRRGGIRSAIIRYLPAAMVVVALLVVVAGQALLANGQVRMTGLVQQLQVAQADHSQQEESVSTLETPSRIVRYATDTEHMIHPSDVTQLPYVPLNVPLATPSVTPAPAAPASTAAASSTRATNAPAASTTTTTPAVGQ